MADPATLIGLLVDDDRRRVFAAIALGATTVSEIVDRSALAESTVQAALPRLVTGGLVQQGDGLEVSVTALRAAAQLRAPRDRGVTDAETPDEQRVLRNFVADGRLVRLPARRAQRQVVLGYVARRFESGRSYTEREVNGILYKLFDDAVSLRRYLVDEQLLKREAGVYRRG